MRGGEANDTLILPPSDGAVAPGALLALHEQRAPSQSQNTCDIKASDGKPSLYQEWKTIFVPGRRILLKAGTYTRSCRLSISRFPPCGSLYVKVAWDSGVIHKGTPRMLDSRQLLSGRWQEGRAAGSSSGNLSVRTELVTHVQLLQLVMHPRGH